MSLLTDSLSGQRPAAACPSMSFRLVQHELRCFKHNWKEFPGGMERAVEGDLAQWRLGVPAADLQSRVIRRRPTSWRGPMQATSPVRKSSWMEVSHLSDAGRTLINDPAGPPRPPFLTYVVRSGGFLFLSGFIGTLPGCPATGEGPTWTPGILAEGGIEAETAQTLANVESALAAAGAARSHIVKVNAYLRDVDLDFDGYNRVYAEFFGDAPPARTMIQAKVYGRSRVEIDCIAEAPI